MPDLNAITELIAAVAGLLTAAGVFLSVLPKLGVHSAKLDQLDAKVTALAGDATTVASEVKAAEPAIKAVTTPKPAA